MKDLNLTSSKFLYMGLSFLIALIPCWIPFWLNKKRDRSEVDSKIQRILSEFFSCSNAFASGVFLSVGLVHLLPDSNKVLSEKWEKYPIAFVISGTAFLLVFLVEQAVFACGKRREETTLLIREEAEKAERWIQSDNDQRNNRQSYQSTSTRSSSFKYSFFSLLLFLTLTLHSFFEGAALGIQKKRAETFFIFIGIICHKGIAAFSLGTVIISLSNLKFFLYSIIFSVSTPLGILLGFLFNQYEDLPVVSGILVAFASGTFLYIGGLELKEEMDKASKKGLKSLFVLIGFGIMSLIGLWA